MKRFSVYIYLSKRILAGFIIILILSSLITTYILSQKLEIISVELKSRRYDASNQITDKKFFAQLQKTLDESRSKRLNNEKIEKKFFYTLVVTRRLGQREYFLNNSGQLIKDGTIIQLDQKSRLELKKAIAKIEEFSPYGDLVSWGEAKIIFPKYAKATIRDLETGLGFRVQNRAGSMHADIQPLTKEDAAIFKTIYGGQWSWRRRAVVVEIEGKKIAASMNGMPHGSGAISGNDFRGHSCLHFLKSRVHGSNKVDPAHQIMVWKSAGKFEEYLEIQPPEKLPEIFVTVLDQLDETLLKQLITNNNHQERMLDFMKKINRAKLEKLVLVKDERNQKTYQGKCKIIDINNKEVSKEFLIKVIKNPDSEGWQIDFIELRKK